jgi:hypothetical protein
MFVNDYIALLLYHETLERASDHMGRAARMVPSSVTQAFVT